MVSHDEMGELRRLKVKDAVIVPSYIGHTTQTCDRHDESASTESNRDVGHKFL